MASHTPRLAKRSRFSSTSGGTLLTCVANYVGGQSVSRDHKGKGSRDPIAPIPAAKQREALAFLVDQILSDKAFKFSPALLRRLTSDTWMHWGSDDMRFGVGIEYPINESVLRIQKIALGQCLAADVLQRLENHELQVDAGADALRMSEIFKSLTDGIWSELTPPAGEPKKAPLAVSTIRRNLQREHLRRLCTIVLGEKQGGMGNAYGFVVFMGGASYPPDAKSLARHHLKDIRDRISKALEPNNTPLDDTTRTTSRNAGTELRRFWTPGSTRMSRDWNDSITSTKSIPSVKDDAGYHFSA